MRKIVFAALFFVASPSLALADITCWYNAAGHYTGADDAVPGFPVGKAVKGNGGDYAWGYTVAGGPSDCPRNLPK